MATAGHSSDLVNTKTVEPIDKQLLDACIHCGLCLPACPTYLATGRETESPRGRIYLLTQWAAGEQELSPRMAEHIDSCLGCLGCQTACPSGVRYENILNAARPHVAAHHPAQQRAIMRFSFKHVLPNYPLLHLGGAFLRLWQALGLGRVLAWVAAPSKEFEQAVRDGQLINPIRKLLFRLHTMESFMPEVPEFKPLPRQSNPSGENGTVQLFSGCMMDIFYNHVNHACVRLLTGQGKRVEVPVQGCCGALAAHAGERDIARELARKNIELLEKTEGPIAVTAAGCGSMLKEYPDLFHDEPQWFERANVLAARFVDITEALADGKFAPSSTLRLERTYGQPVKVAYHAACHLAHAQGVRKAPEQLLEQAAADVGPHRLQLKPLREAEHCCGSAGIYNLINTELSMQVLERKMAFINESGASVVVTTNPGCMLQIETGARERGLSLKVVHLAELLDCIYSV